jgi:glucose-6-phosphate 1-dehydrogenase
MNKPVEIIIFGASGDLTRRKLIPALYNLFKKNRLPERTTIIGFARRPYSHKEFQDITHKGLIENSQNTFDPSIWEAFSKDIFYFQGNLANLSDFIELQKYLTKKESQPIDRLYYLATSPNFYKPIIANLGQANMASQEDGYRNIIIEKPFGHDLQSARELNHAAHTVFDEDQIFRIDHYLGKETAQNILFFRFANTIFEPVWNRNYIDNIQITVAENVDVEHRADYYDTSGVLRDMLQNHLLQLLSLIAMEPPASFEADALRNEKVKVLKSLRPILFSNTILAQYEGYCATEGVASRSKTPTFAALTLFVDNWRWNNVPFYLRSGKALERKVTEVIIEFKLPPHMLFDLPKNYTFTPNILSLCIYPDEGIHLKFEAKVPDSAQETRSVDMEFHYRTSFGDNAIPEAYERLLLDALRGDASLFSRSDEIEQAWKLIDPIIKKSSNTPKENHIQTYKPGTWGPLEANALLEKEGRAWRLGCDLHD